MPKYLLCYTVGLASERGYTDGFVIKHLPELTEETLAEAQAEQLEFMQDEQPEKGFTQLVWKSVTRLDSEGAIRSWFRRLWFVIS